MISPGRLAASCRSFGTYISIAEISVDCRVTSICFHPGSYRSTAEKKHDHTTAACSSIARKLKAVFVDFAFASLFAVATTCSLLMSNCKELTHPLTLYCSLVSLRRNPIIHSQYEYACVPLNLYYFHTSKQQETSWISFKCMDTLAGPRTSLNHQQIIGAVLTTLMWICWPSTFSRILIWCRVG